MKPIKPSEVKTLEFPFVSLWRIIVYYIRRWYSLPRIWHILTLLILLIGLIGAIPIPKTGPCDCPTHLRDNGQFYLKCESGCYYNQTFNEQGQQTKLEILKTEWHPLLWDF